MNDSPSIEARKTWMAVLARASREQLEAGLAHVMDNGTPPAFDWLRSPQTGLAMVRGRIGGSGDPFNLGEATVTRATLRLRSRTDDAPVGVAVHLGRDRRRAELAALADALLQLPTHAERLHETLIEPVAAQLAQRRATRQTDAASTRVEFFTMVRGD